MSQLLQFYKSFQQAKAPEPKAAPTFEDLAIDDQLTENQRVIKYVKSTIGLQRLVHVKMLADVSESIGFAETVSSIVPLLAPLSKDIEPVVKQHLAEQLKYLAKFCVKSGGEDGYHVLVNHLLPLTAALLEDDKPEVRHAASMTLVDVAELVRVEDIGQHVLTIILRLAHEDDREEMRMTASQLLNLLAECLGQDLCKQFVIPEVVSLAEDPVFRVRKSTALNFHMICKVGGEHELLERLMPAFVRLSKDDMYRVRRACAESLSEIAKNVSEDIRLGVLVEIFLRLSQDPSRLVKQSTLSQSGMFISSLPGRAVNEAILSNFCSMASNPTGDISVDAELKHICAYSFPAVLLVIGQSRWKEVRELYHNLAQSRSANIKQTLAYSLHEIAKILADQRLVEEELVQVFEDMIQDTELVQMGVIKNLASFLGMLPEPCRVSYLPLLHEILHSTNPFNWRLRQYLALQLPQLILLPPKPDIFRTLFRLVMILLQDPVASVRRDSFKGVTALIAKLYEMSEATPSDDINENLIKSSRQNLDEMCSSINSFIENDKFQLRLLWVELSYRLLLDLPKDLFEKYFLYGLVKLINDRVSNVRVAISYVLTGWDVNTAPTWSKMAKKNPVESDEERTTRKESPWNWLLNGSDIKSCIEKLAVDKNDVYLNMVKLKPRFPTIEFTSTTARGGASQRSDISIASSDVGSSKASEADDAAVVMGSDHDSLNNDDDTEEEIEPVNRNRWSTGSGHSAEYILNLSASNSPAASLDLQDIGIVIGQIEHLPSDELPVPKRKMSITERESNDDVDEEEIKNDTGAEVNTESEKADGEVPLADETATVDAEEISVDFSNEADLVLKDNIQVREPETIQVSTKEKNDTDISKEDQGNNDEKAAKEIMLEGSNNVESVDEFLDSLKMNE